MNSKLLVASYTTAFCIFVALVPVSTLSPSLVLFAVIAIQLCSAFSPKVDDASNRLFFIDSFLLLSLMLFGGRPTVALAFVIAPCVLLNYSKDVVQLFSRSAVSVTSILFLAFLLEVTSGSLTLPGQEQLRLETVTAMVLAVVCQSVLSTFVFVIWKTDIHARRSWRHALLDDYLTTLGKYLAVGVVAGLAATVAQFAGLNTAIMVWTAGAISYLAVVAYKKNSYLGGATLTQDKTDSDDESDDAEVRFRSAFDFAAIGMALVSAEGRWLQVNRALCNLLGYSERELLSVDFLTIIHSDDIRPATETLRRLRQNYNTVDQCEIRFQHKSGREVWGLWNASFAGESHVTARPLIFQIQDITDRKRVEAQLQHEALHDVLTGLPNRAMFMDHLELAIARAERNEDRKFAVLYLDLDRFKIINDSLGHTIGDQLLVEVAERLGKCVRAGDTVARFGGDEFVLLVEDILEESDAVYLAERIKGALTAPFTLSGREIFMTVSIGIASIWTSYRQADVLVRDADAAMYRAKSLGKNRHEIYDSAMHARVNDRLQIETLLRLAVERKEFSVYYQPIVDLDSFRLSGFEALVRWKHPEKGFISPADFIPLAEETGLIIDIGEWVLTEACRQMERWQKIFPSDPPLFVSVNLSGKQFIQSDLIQRIEQIIKDTKIDPKGLKLEITESAVMDDVETATEMLKKLRALGVKLSIDDFGTGYSSLSYLHKFPIDTLKIDRSFVTSMSEDAENIEIVRTIVTLAQNLGMNVIAEGVETKEQLATLRKLECEYGQGYFFSKAVDSMVAENLICETYNADAPIDLVINSTPARKVVYLVR